MSGHRGTTFFNSVLNMAYLMVVLGEDYVMERPTLHVGDDIYFGVRSYTDAGNVIRKIKESPLRMNPRKQSVGHTTVEFLRVASSGRVSRSYLARAIASTASGNWVSSVVLNPLECLTTMLTAAHTLRNRSENESMPLLLKSSITRVIGDDCLDDVFLLDLLTGRLALNNGPMFKSGGAYRYVKATLEYKTLDRYGYNNLPIHATKGYLTNCATQLERDVLQRAGLSVVSYMEESSYSKSLEYVKKFQPILRFSGVHTSHAIGSARAERLVKVSPPRGVLSKYPLLVLIKDRLPDTVVTEALATLGYTPSRSMPLKLLAWGEYDHGCIVHTPMSYSDASMFGRRTLASVLSSDRYYYI
nr:MAG: hypothetical protein H3Bulk429802_000002 [Totiviridae sp.]